MLVSPRIEVKGNRTARERLIVALDCESQPIALNLVDRLGDSVNFYKVGWRLFIQNGMVLVDELRNRGKDVFLDLKMDDIEETIESAVRNIADEVMFLTIHGNGATARAARRGRGEKTHPKLLSVTLLSSLDEKDLLDLFSIPSLKGNKPNLNEYVMHRAQQALDSGVEGLIASGESIKMLRDRFGEDAIIVSPGIRPAGSSIDDHKRSLTPREALLYGSDYLVVGRPIAFSTDPNAAVETILKEMDDALKEKQRA